jgi:hypothetical protein
MGSPFDQRAFFLRWKTNSEESELTSQRSATPGMGSVFFGPYSTSPS